MGCTGPLATRDGEGEDGVRTGGLGVHVGPGRLAKCRAGCEQIHHFVGCRDLDLAQALPQDDALVLADLNGGSHVDVPGEKVDQVLIVNLDV